MLVQTAVRRTRQIMEGSKPMVPARNRDVVVALREIATRKVRPLLDPSRPQASEATGPPGDSDEAILATAIEEVIVDRMEPRGSLEELRELESLPDDGFHEIMEGEAEGDEQEDDDRD
jgi:DNA-directed RNA polymerase subunit K/omega